MPGFWERSTWAHWKARCTYNRSRYYSVVMHRHVPAAGHNSDLAGKEEAGKVLPDLALGVSLWFLVPHSQSTRPNRGLIPKPLDWRYLTLVGARAWGPAWAVRIQQAQGLDYSQDLTLIPVTAWDHYICVKLCSLKHGTSWQHGLRPALLLGHLGGLRASVTLPPFLTCSTSHFLSNVYVLKNLLFRPHRCQAIVVASLHPFTWQPLQQ